MADADQTKTTHHEERTDRPTSNDTGPEGEGNDGGENIAHDCLERMRYVGYEWVGDCYLDRYVCSVCEAEFFMLFERTQLLGEDDEVVEEYT
jgi:hypothetical protein